MSGPFDSLAIDISDKCNLRCSYCFEKVAGPDSIHPVDPRRLFSGIDYFLENLIPERAPVLHFHFGRREPLLNFPLLSDITSYLLLKGESLSFEPVFHLTTNGSCLDSQIIRLLKEHSFDLRISLDGFQELHDKNRKYKDGTGSFARIGDNLRMLNRQGISFTINAVYSPGTNCRELCDYFRALFVKRVDFFPLWVSDNEPIWENHEINVAKTIKSIEAWVGSLIRELLCENQNKGPKIVLVEKYLQHLFGFRSSPYYCGAGRNYIGVTSSGNIYPCLKFINTEGWSLGDIKDGVIGEKVTRYFENVAPPVEDLFPCADCSINSACKGLCYLDRLNLDRHRIAFDFYCAFKKAFFSAANRLYETFKDRKPEVLVQQSNLEQFVDSLI